MNVYILIRVVALPAVILPMIGGCYQDRNSHEGAYYSLVFEVSSVDQFLNGFNGVDDLSACEAAIEERVQEGFEIPL